MFVYTGKQARPPGLCGEGHWDLGPFTTPLGAVEARNLYGRSRGIVISAHCWGGEYREKRRAVAASKRGRGRADSDLLATGPLACTQIKTGQPNFNSADVARPSNPNKTQSS